MKNTKVVVSTPDAPRPAGPYAQGVRWGRLLFVSGQLPLDPETGELVPGDIAAQARRCLENVLAVVRAAGGGPGDVVKTTVYLKDIAAAPVVNGVYEEFFREAGGFPARALVEVADLPRGAGVEIEAVAVLPGEEGT